MGFTHLPLNAIESTIMLHHALVDKNIKLFSLNREKRINVECKDKETPQQQQQQQQLQQMLVFPRKKIKNTRCIECKHLINR